MAKISTPVPGYNGRVVGVTFEDGHGETDDEAALAYFARQGYVIEGADDFDGPEEDAAEEVVVPLLGNEYTDPDSGPYRDAADPRNDMIPVGGVKSDGQIVGGPGRGKRVSTKQRSEETSGNTDTQPTAPGQPVQELGDPEQHSATPAGTNPVEATTEQENTDATAADSGSESKKG